MAQRRVWFAPLLAAAAALYAALPARAGALPFTWNPAGSGPPLAGPGTEFTADTIDIATFVRSVVQPDQNFVARRINVITGFSLGGTPVTPLGFGSGYGLYFDIADTGDSVPPNPLHFTSSDLILKADPGNQNG